MQPPDYALARPRVIVLYESAGQAQCCKLVGTKNLHEETTRVLEQLWLKDQYLL